MTAVDGQPDLTCRDAWVHHHDGRLFVRIWSPPPSTAGSIPLVLFHDSLGCVELWRDFPARLSARTGRTVIAYDRLGFGRSDPRSGRLPVDFVADEAATYVPALREQVGIDGFIAFGHSVGGAMAVHCAARYPTACAALVTESSQAFVEERTTEGIAAAQASFQDVEQLARLERYHGDKARWVLEAWTRTWLDPAFAGWSLRPVLPTVVSPLLAIHGSLDEYGSTRHPELIAQLAAGPSRAEIVDGVSHVPHREVEDEVVSLVAEFVAGLD